MMRICAGARPNHTEGTATNVTKLMTKVKTGLAGLATMAMLATVGMMPAAPVPQAYADTYDDLLNAQSQQADSAQREADLRAQLSGVSSDLADKIVELDKLTNTTIPAAQTAVEKANAAAAAAKSEAEAAASRLDAAQKDKDDLEKKIKETGADYDDAHAAVAQLARDEMHGSSTSDLMSVVTGSANTDDFVSSMQSRQAISRNEAQAADSAAVSLGTSMNRTERLAAIKEQISKLKDAKDKASAAAQTAADDAQSQRDSLEKLRKDGTAKRTELEGMKDQLTDDVAAQAAQTVLLQSQVDSYNQKWQKEQAEAAAQAAAEAAKAQGTYQAPATNTNANANTNTGGNASADTGGNAASGDTGGNTNTGGDTGGNAGGNTGGNVSTDTGGSTNTGSSSGGQGTTNGDYGNAYVAGQCTWWAYDRRKQMGIGTPSYLGNGGQWWSSAPSYGLRVDHNPEVGAALSFLPGQDGADGFYGHVAVVEAVYGDGTFLISEMNALAGPYNTNTRTLTNQGQYWFVH